MKLSYLSLIIINSDQKQIPLLRLFSKNEMAYQIMKRK